VTGSTGASAGSHGVPAPVAWGGGQLTVLDQRALPARERHLACRTPEDVARAIRSLAVRGAPLIGVAAAFGVALAAAGSRGGGATGAVEDMSRARSLLVSSRPTAVNLAVAADRVLDAGRRASEGGHKREVREAALAEARAIQREEEASCLEIGRRGAVLVPEHGNILTHCNTGALATGGIGTALGVIATAHATGKRLHVWVTETRPLWQGARLTSWELQRLGIPMTLVADGAVGSLMARGLVDLAIVGADRIAANGDTANKIGTYPIAALADHNDIAFVVAAPRSTVDLSTQDGSGIVVEDRDEEEVTRPLGLDIAPKGTHAANPAFDVTPASLIDAIVTEAGVVHPPFGSGLRRVLGDGPAPDPTPPNATAERSAVG